MEKNERVLTGDERTLVLFLALLNQGMSVEDILVFLRLEDTEDFLVRNNLKDKLEDLDSLRSEIFIQVEKLAAENSKKE